MLVAESKAGYLGGGIWEGFVLMAAESVNRALEVQIGLCRSLAVMGLLLICSSVMMRSILVAAVQCARSLEDM